jgi:hypothetical protein
MYRPEMSKLAGGAGVLHRRFMAWNARTVVAAGSSPSASHAGSARDLESFDGLVKQSTRVTTTSSVNNAVRHILLDMVASALKILRTEPHVWSDLLVDTRLTYALRKLL